MKHIYVSVLALVTFSIASVGFSQPPTQTPVTPKSENQQEKSDDTKPDGSAKKADSKAAQKDSELKGKPKATKQQSDLHWVFLESGKSTEGLPSEEIDAMLGKQLANYKRLAAENQLLTGGTVNDPEQKLKSMVIVRAKNKSEIAEMFLPDPYVQSGYIKLETVQMKISHGKINTKTTSPGMEEFFMVVLEQSEEKNPISESEQADTDQSLKKMSAEDGLLLAVKLLDPQKKRRGILVFKKPKEEKTIQQVMERLKEFPPVKNGKWRTRSFPLNMGKGSFKDNG